MQGFWEPWNIGTCISKGSFGLQRCALDFDSIRLLTCKFWQYFLFRQFWKFLLCGFCFFSTAPDLLVTRDLLSSFFFWRVRSVTVVSQEHEHDRFYSTYIIKLNFAKAPWKMKDKLPSVVGTMRRSSLWPNVTHRPTALGPQVGIVDGSWITGRSLTWPVTAGKVPEASGTRAHATGPFGLQRISE